MKRRNKTTAFYLEALLLTLILLLCMATTVRLFGSAGAIGNSARQKTEAVQVVRNAAALFAAGDEAFGTLPAPGEERTVTLYFDDGGALVTYGCYAVTAQLSCEARERGSMAKAELTVTEDMAEKEPLCTMTTEKYRPEA